MASTSRRTEATASADRLVTGRAMTVVNLGAVLMPPSFGLLVRAPTDGFWPGPCAGLSLCRWACLSPAESGRRSALPSALGRVRDA